MRLHCFWLNTSEASTSLATLIIRLGLRRFEDSGAAFEERGRTRMTLAVAVVERRVAVPAERDAALQTCS